MLRPSTPLLQVSCVLVAGRSSHLDSLAVASSTDTNLVFRALIVLGLVVFGFALAVDRGLVGLALDSDKSYISYVILALYLAASAHWLWLAQLLTRERRRFAALEADLGGAEGNADEAAAPAADGGLIGEFLENLRNLRGHGDRGALVTAFGDELVNRHAIGHFASDALLKLGLLGTVVGFILMLLPIGEVEAFDPSLMRELLSAMSGGMAVALYTTLAGLVTSTLLKLQYHLLDSSAVDLATRLAVLVQVRLDDAA